MRGYGDERIAPPRSSAIRCCISWATWSECSMRLGEKTAVIAGHDWGAPVAWHAALLRPDRFRAVVGLSVPYRPRGSIAPTTVMPQNAEASFYQLYFQAPGVAEAELETDVRASRAQDSVFRIGRCAATQPSWRCRRRRRHGAAGRRISHPHAEPGIAARVAQRNGPRLLRTTISALRISRRPELVPQHRSQLGIARAYAAQR